MSARRQPDFWDWTLEVSYPSLDHKIKTLHFHPILLCMNISDNYCQRKGIGCHKEEDQIDIDEDVEDDPGMLIEDITICCCDTDL